MAIDLVEAAAEVEVDVENAVRMSARAGDVIRIWNECCYASMLIIMK